MSYYKFCFKFKNQECHGKKQTRFNDGYHFNSSIECIKSHSTPHAYMYMYMDVRGWQYIKYNAQSLSTKWPKLKS